MWLTAPSPRQCREVISQLKDSHREIRLYATNAKLFVLFVLPLFKKATIERLRVQSSPLTTECILSLSLPTNNTLQQLFLHCNSVTDDVVVILCQELLHNTTLNFLSLWGNPDITSLSALHFSELIQVNSTLCSLDLSYNSLSFSDGVIIILNSLITNTNLKTLVLDIQHEVASKSCKYFELLKHKLIFQSSRY